jgi:hypothetical protein
MDQTLDPLLELDEGAEIGQADHLALDLLSDSILFLDVFPRVFGELLIPQGYAFVLFAESEDHDLEFLADLEELGGMADLPP